MLISTFQFEMYRLSKHHLPFSSNNNLTQYSPWHQSVHRSESLTGGGKWRSISRIERHPTLKTIEPLLCSNLYGHRVAEIVGTWGQREEMGGKFHPQGLNMVLKRARNRLKGTNILQFCLKKPDLRQYCDYQKSRTYRQRK